MWQSGEPDLDSATLADVVDWLRSRCFGKYRGTVVEGEDPNEQGRLRVRVPSVLGDAELWALPCVPYAGANVGLYLRPEPGTGVWVEFEGGDPTYPVWTGCFWGAGQLPDDPGGAVKVLRTLRSTLRLDDEAGEVLLGSDSGGQSTWTDEVVTSAGTATHTVSAEAVTAAKGAGSVEVSDSGTSVNGGALEVT